MGAFTSWRSRHQLDLSSQGDLARLHRLTVCSRWALALILWLTIGTLSLWTLRRDFGNGYMAMSQSHERDNSI